MDVLEHGVGEGAPTAEELIALIETMRLVRDERIKRLKGYIEYREKRHRFDAEDIEKLKNYLAQCESV